MKNNDTPSDEFEKTREQLHRQMLSAVSHDLKTPLATIIGSLEVYTRMDEKLSHDKKLVLIKSALGEAYRLDNFVTNILDMAKLESGMAKINRERCDLASLINDSITRLGPKAEKGNITIIAVGEKIPVYTDPMLLGRAVGILLDNALKHAGKQPEITIEYGQDANQGFIRICDNGPGIPNERQEAIFSKYTRFSKQDQQNAGTGLGLAICKLIMELLSGYILVSDAPQGGAMFTLRFASA